jgi:hypothetical protein
MLAAATAIAGCGSTPAENGKAGGPAIAVKPKERTEPGYDIKLLSWRIESPMFHPYATMAINSDRFDQLDNDYGKMRQRDGNSDKSTIALRDVVVEEYARFFKHYDLHLQFWDSMLLRYRNRKMEPEMQKLLKQQPDKKTFLKVMLKNKPEIEGEKEAVPYRDVGKMGNGEWEEIKPLSPVCNIEYNENENTLTAEVLMTSLEKILQEISNKIERGYAASAEVDKKIGFSFEVKNMPLQRAMDELCMSYEFMKKEGLEIEMEQFSFSVRPGPIRLFKSVKLQDKITVDNVRLFLDLSDKAIFALVTYPGGGDTSVYFVYRFPPGKVLALPESMSVFSTRRMIKVK